MSPSMSKPCTFRRNRSVLCLFEIGPRDGDVYTTLRGHLSSALKSAELVQVALEAEAKAIKSDQLKTHLLANVSHELRTPFNIILGLSQIALSTPNPYGIELPAQLTKDLGYIYDSGEHLIRLINDLLDTSRAEIGELDLCFEPVSPRTLLKEMYETFKKTSANKQKKVELLLDVPDHLPILHADPVRLRQILMNLLSNASSSPRREGSSWEPRCSFPISISGSPIPVPGSRRNCRNGYLSPLSKPIRPGSAGRGSDWGSASPAGWWRCTAARSRWTACPGREPLSTSTFLLPGLDYASAREVDPEGAQPVLLWLSSNRDAGPGRSKTSVRRTASTRAGWGPLKILN